MWKRYFTVPTLDEALELLSDRGGEARIVAGATDLMLELERGQRPGIDTLIDITRIPDLDSIEEDSQGWVHIGPLATHNHCAGSQLIVEHAFALAQACWQVGAPQIRNRGTVAGNLITASPANDSIPALMALGAKITLRSAKGDRVIPIDAFYEGVRRTVMHDDEILVDIAFPNPPDGTRSTFFKLGLRRAQAISVVNAALALQMDGEVVRSAGITLGSVAPTVIHADEAEEFLVGKQLSKETIEQAAILAAAAAKPIDDLRGSAGYRSEMVRICTLRGLRSLMRGTERLEVPDEPVMLWGAGEGHQIERLPEVVEHIPGTKIETTVNGKAYSVDGGHEKSLLRFLREDLGLTGSKEGCAEGECGACTVFLDGAAVMACLVPAPRAHGAEIVTIEGLGGNGKLHPVQRAFVEEGAVQCGYCTPGFIMSGVKLLEEKSQPSRSDIEQAIAGNLCRCTGYYKIISALELASRFGGQGTGGTGG
ncbi:MAG TPA: 2Fe-2S iron-sulfur cluster binding domain-containing protein [Anaerolineae bacterium]|nr:2Fe-2S iron-sulfur cluster binding domain-containing protein [Anaerolineae bacterium]